MNPNEHYDVVNGRVQTRSLEIHIVDHCNLRCWGCCSLSPISKKHLVSPGSIRTDLALAKQFISPQRLKLVGGEPLLHSQLIECLIAAREADITPSLSVTTNGFLATRVNNDFWELIDHMTVSLYPEPTLPEETIQFIQKKADENAVEVNWKTQNEFVGMDRREADWDGENTLSVYEECWLRRRCHLIANGRFYTCTRPAHIHAVSGLEQSPYLNDGIKLKDGKNLLDYLVRKDPLKSCYLCLGGSAELESHRQLSLAEIKQERLDKKKIYQDYAISCDK